MDDPKNVCSTPGCDKPTTLLCPVCKGFGVNSWFCSQECFKSIYKKHKISHQVYAETHSAKVGAVSDKAFINFNFTGPLRPGNKAAKRRALTHIDVPDYAEGQIPHSERQSGNQFMKTLNKHEMNALRETSKFGREVLDLAIAATKVGVTTEEIDNVVFNACMERNCYPSPLNYYGFPKSCCTSINEVICHGIPDSRPLEEGDILNIDITTYFNKYHGDLNETIFIGKPSDDDVSLVKCSYDCLANSMDVVTPGMRYQEFGKYIEKRARESKHSVVRTYCGHGIHKLFHCLPNVPHYKDNRAPGEVKVGHSFTIEPMINAGVYEDVTWPDKWTAVTRDGKKSAQFEHTMCVTNKDEEFSCSKNYPGGPQIEVMTKRTGAPPIPEDFSSLFSKLDIKHFEMYGRPHFIDQLIDMKYDIKKLYH